jgi:hypothetical protein
VDLRAKRRPTDGLSIFRRIFILVAKAFLIIGVGFIFIEPWSGQNVPDWTIASFVVLAIVSVSIAVWRRRSPVRGDTPPELRRSFARKLFTAIGAGELFLAATLAATIRWNRLWIGVSGLAVAYLDLLLVAPGRRELARRQREITAAGSTLSLISALNLPRRSGPGMQAGLE